MTTTIQTKAFRLLWAYAYYKVYGSLDVKAYKERFNLTRNKAHDDLGTGQKDFKEMCETLDRDMPELAEGLEKLFNPLTTLPKVPVANVPQGAVSYVNISLVVNHQTGTIDFQPFSQEVYNDAWQKIAKIDYGPGSIDLTTGCQLS